MTLPFLFVAAGLLVEIPEVFVQHLRGVFGKVALFGKIGQTGATAEQAGDIQGLVAISELRAAPEAFIRPRHFCVHAPSLP